MAKQGLVVAIEGDMATIESCKSSKCESCTKRTKIGACDACSDNEEKAPDRVVAYNRMGAAIGDKVEYAKTKSSGIILAVISFVVPVIFAMLSYFVCTVFTDNEQIKGRVVAASFAVALLFAGVYSYKLSKKQCDHSVVCVLEKKNDN